MEKAEQQILEYNVLTLLDETAFGGQPKKQPTTMIDKQEIEPCLLQMWMPTFLDCFLQIVSTTKADSISSPTKTTLVLELHQELISTQSESGLTMV